MLVIGRYPDRNSQSPFGQSGDSKTFCTLVSNNGIKNLKAAIKAIHSHERDLPSVQRQRPSLWRPGGRFVVRSTLSKAYTLESSVDDNPDDAVLMHHGHENFCVKARTRSWTARTNGTCHMVDLFGINTPTLRGHRPDPDSVAAKNTSRRSTQPTSSPSSWIRLYPFLTETPGSSCQAVSFSISTP